MAYTTINDSSVNFQTAIYTGNGGTQSITNDGNSNLKPDFIWVKDRSATNDHKLSDSNRGSTYTMESNTSLAEYNDTTAVTSFNTDGFTTGSNGNTNTNSNTYVAWQWKANGGTTSSNSDGSITSTVQVNSTSKFSVVSYTGTGSNATIGHGLGVTPDLIIVKLRSGAGDWTVYNSIIGNTKFLRLNSGNAEGTQSTYWQDTSPTTSVFSIGTAGDVNTSSGTHVAYCFSQVKGYSKIGTYKGTGDVDGPFLFCGFKPAFILTKRLDDTGSWLIHDNKREGYNSDNDEIEVNTNAVEANNDRLDLLSNGVKIRNTSGYVNASGASYTFLAIADAPLVASNGVAATTRAMG